MANKRPKVTIYGDGSIYPNPGEGGWATILCYNGYEREISGYHPGPTTNIVMEMTALIEGLKCLKQSCEVDYYSDLQLLVNGVNTWAGQWQSKNWRGNTGKKTANVELWKQILEFKKVHFIQAHWIRGHDGHFYNERVDTLAGEARTSRRSFSTLRQVAKSLQSGG